MGVQVREKPKGSGVWWVFVNHHGQRKAKRVGVGPKGKKLAEDVAVKLRAKLLDGDVSVFAPPAPPPSAVPRFREVAAEWIGRYASLRSVRASTLANRETFIARHLLPFFGDRRVDSLNLDLVEDFIGAKRAPGGSKRGKALADSTLRVNLPTLRMILDYCVRRKWLTVNPLRGEPIWSAPAAAAQPDPFTPAELTALVAAAESIAPAWGLMVRGWAQSGMRSGELRGLQHQDFDAATGEVQVRRTRTMGVLGPTKTRRSVRRASLLHPTCEVTLAWQPGATAESRSVVAQLERLMPIDPMAPLFGSLKHPGRPMEERELHSIWTRTVARAKVRHRSPETLRHSCISILLSRGAPLVYVAAQMGHSSRIMLQSYALWVDQGALAALQPAATPAQPRGGVGNSTPGKSAG